MSLSSDQGEISRFGFSLESIPDSHDPKDVRLVLRDLGEPKMSPLAVDFLEPKVLHRLKHGLSKNQPLSRAIGLKSLDPARAPSVFDATAGLGMDAFFTAALGCRVRAVERSKVVAALLTDGHRRLLAAPGTELAKELHEIAGRLSFEAGDARIVLGALKDHERPDVIYLDPMYPEESRSESALPKKAMQMFRKLIGGDVDTDELLRIALKVARSRVVVKRPLRAPHLETQPTHSFAGKTVRYDMYLVRERTV